MKKNEYFTELTVKEITEINGGSWLSWAIGFIEGTVEFMVTSHTQQLVANNSAPSVLAFK
jgi:hypothetical protein